MTLIQAIILGIIEGLTEFIPVSSTAHLLITQTLLQIPANQASFIFSVVVQLGAIIALIIYFWRDLVEIVKTTLANLPNLRRFTEMPEEARLGWFIIFSSIPALAAGYLLKDLVEQLFQQPLQHASVRLMTAAVLLAGAERFGRKDRGLDQMTWIDSLVVGLFQILAVFPGSSRSGSTMSGGMYLGFDRKSAARYAMLISIPVMLAAGLVESLDLVGLQGGSEALAPVVVGIITAGITGWLSIRWLLNYLQNHSLYVFSAYCFIASIVCAIFYLLG